MAGDSSVKGPGGTLLYVEDPGGGVLMPAVKLHTGALGVDSGPMSATNPLFFQGRTPSIATFTTLALNGQLVKTGSGIALIVFLINTTGAASFAQVFDTTATVANGTVPLQTSASTANNGQTLTTLGSTIYGLPFSTGLWLQVSTTLQTMTKEAASTASAGFVLYI